MTSMIHNKEKLKDISTAYKTKLFDAFYKDADTSHEAFASVETVAAKWYQDGYILGNPAMENWVGGKNYSAFRAFEFEIELVEKHRSTAIGLAELYGDSAGVIGKRLSGWLASVNSDKNKLATDRLLAGNSTVGHDGVNMFSTSHPFGPTGSLQSNYSTDSLNAVSLNTAIVTMQNWKDEDGMPLGATPTVLMVGPQNLQEAMKLTAAIRPYALGDTGKEVTSGVDAATSAPNNFLGHAIRVVLNKRISGFEWFLIDDSKPGVRPVIIAQQGEPHPEDNLADYKEVPEGRFSVEWIAGVGYGPWFSCVGNFATA